MDYCTACGSKNIRHLKMTPTVKCLQCGASFFNDGTRFENFEESRKRDLTVSQAIAKVRRNKK